ncbi:MAG TPA: membrane dipeptidase [Candidatus Korarchaeota archaeon]|nr:membrane dipeptidase [Candidatus Korarchaeota archaeon]
MAKELSKEEVDEALNLHKECHVVDTHCDTLQALFNDIFPSITPLRVEEGLGKRSEKGHIDIPRLKEGGVDCQVFAIFISKTPNPPKALHRALNLVDVFYKECEKNSEDLSPTTSYKNILKAIESGKIAAMLSLEGGEALEADVSMLRIFHRLGIRMMSLTWNHRNQLADGVREERTRSGLTNLGVKVVDEMEELGIIIDVSHLSESCFWDLVEITDSPLIASHSNCRVLCDHPRNLTDRQIEAIADRGGVIGMNFYPKFLRKEGQASVSDVVDHMEHIINLVGIDHVGLGSDFDGISSTPVGLEDVSKMPNITIELVSRGYGREEIRKILGENHLRVFSRVIG